VAEDPESKDGEPAEPLVEGEFRTSATEVERKALKAVAPATSEAIAVAASIRGETSCELPRNCAHGVAAAMSV